MVQGVVTLLPFRFVIENPHILAQHLEVRLKCKALQNGTVVAGKMVGDDSNFHVSAYLPNR